VETFSVSVVIASYNHAPYLRACIASAQNQTLAPREIIVVDDGSTDGTSAAVESFKDARIRLIRRPHLGIVRSANYGIAQARGQFIARLDSDDLSLPERIQLQLAVLEKNPAAVLCHTACELFGGDAGSQKPGRFTRNSMLTAIKMCFLCPLIHSSVMYRKAAFDLAGGYLEKTPVAEDYSLYTRLIKQGSFIGIPKKLVKYRIHTACATQENLQLMKRLTGEIAIQHLKSFFKYSDSQAYDHYINLTNHNRKKDIKLWGSFCFKVLSLSQCWRLEPLAWLASQSIKIALGKILNCCFSLKAHDNTNVSSK